MDKYFVQLSSCEIPEQMEENVTKSKAKEGSDYLR